MKNKKEAIIGLLVFIGYIILSFFSGDIFTIISINNYPISIKILITFIYDFVILLSLIGIYTKTLIKDLKDYKRNLKYYINKYFKYWFLNLGLMMISSTLISMFTNINSSTNQEYIVKLLNNFPLYTLISTVLIAPVTEELMFRLNFRKIFKTDLLFIIMSGITFGAMHLSVATSLLELLYIIPYSIPGFIFAYTLKKSNNIFVPISLHLFHNTIMMILQLLTATIL